MTKLWATVCAYQGIVVCSPRRLQDGLVVDTAVNLGVSPEALELLRSVRTGNDTFGVPVWFADRNGVWWFAGARILNPKTAEAPRDFALGPHVRIENIVTRTDKRRVRTYISSLRKATGGAS